MKTSLYRISAFALAICTAGNCMPADATGALRLIPMSTRAVFFRETFQTPSAFERLAELGRQSNLETKKSIPDSHQADLQNWLAKLPINLSALLMSQRNGTSTPAAPGVSNPAATKTAMPNPNVRKSKAPKPPLPDPFVLVPSIMADDNLPGLLLAVHRNLKMTYGALEKYTHLSPTNMRQFSQRAGHLSPNRKNDLFGSWRNIERRIPRPESA